MIKALIILCALLVPAACRAQSPNSSADESGDSLSEKPFYEEDFAKQQGEGQITCLMNKDTSYVLCKRSLTNNDKVAPPTRAYTVYDLESQQQTYAGRIDGDVQWHDLHTIRVRRLQRVGGGAMSQRDYDTYVDVRFGKPVNKEGPKEKK